MFGRDRGDRGALVAFGMMLAAVVIVFAIFRFGDPPNQIIESHANPNRSGENGQSQPFEQTVYWGVFTAKDTFAQWIAALAAIGSVGVSIWAVRLVKSSLQETRNAVATAKNANQISRKTGRDQSRAYVFVNAAELYFLSESEPKVTVLLSVKNNGSTPAKWFCVRSAVDICEGSDPPEAPPFEGVTWNALGGGDTLTVGARSDSNTFDFTFDCRDSIICRGEVEYETFFGEVFVSGFAFIAHPRFRIRFEPTTVSPESTPFVQITTRGKEIPTKMSRAAGSLKTFHKKT